MQSDQVSQYVSSLILLCFCGFSCTVPKNVLTQDSHSVNRIVVSSSNLSEDGSFLSSQEDELLLLIFDYTNDQLEEELLSETFTFDKANRVFSADLDMKFSAMPKLLALIELDSLKTREQITHLVQANHVRLLLASKNHDLHSIEELLGDDDLLGIQIITPKDRRINFSGTWRMDRYEYQINLIAHQ